MRLQSRVVALTCVVGQPPVAPALEVCAVELCALLSPEVPRATRAALHQNMGAETMGARVSTGVWGLRSSAIHFVSWGPGSCPSAPSTPPYPTPHPGGASLTLPWCLAEDAALRRGGGYGEGGWGEDWPTQALPQCGRCGGCAWGPRSWCLHLSCGLRAHWEDPKVPTRSWALPASLQGALVGKARPESKAR